VLRWKSWKMEGRRGDKVAGALPVAMVMLRRDSIRRISGWQESMCEANRG
jgi:hypothetical protein